MVTCWSRHGRNRRAGELIARGATPEEAVGRDRAGGRGADDRARAARPLAPARRRAADHRGRLPRARRATSLGELAAQPDGTTTDAGVSIVGRCVARASSRWRSSLARGSSLAGCGGGAAALARAAGPPDSASSCPPTRRVYVYARTRDSAAASGRRSTRCSKKFPDRQQLLGAAPGLAPAAGRRLEHRREAGARPGDRRRRCSTLGQATAGASG